MNPPPLHYYWGKAMLGSADPSLTTEFFLQVPWQSGEMFLCTAETHTEAEHFSRPFSTWGKLF